MIDVSDSLRIPDKATAPDERTLAFVRVNTLTGEKHRISLVDQYEAVARFRLNQSVPKNVAIHFETAKNLYLYAWFVYRFYPVAEQHALSTLEYALRVRQPEFVESYTQKHRRGTPPGLGALLKTAINNGLIRSDRFPQKYEWALRRAKVRFQIEHMERMIRDGLTEDIYDDSDVVPSEDDLNFDWASNILKHVPDLRNIYAHGSSMLVPSVLHTFDVATGMVNQLYPE